MLVLKSLAYFLLAGLFEIGGGYLIWQWLRNGASLWYAFFGAVITASCRRCSPRAVSGASMPLTAASLSYCRSSGAGASTASRPTASTSSAASSRSRASLSSCTRRAEATGQSTERNSGLRFRLDFSDFRAKKARPFPCGQNSYSNMLRLSKNFDWHSRKWAGFSL